VLALPNSKAPTFHVISQDTPKITQFTPASAIPVPTPRLHQRTSPRRRQWPNSARRRRASGRRCGGCRKKCRRRDVWRRSVGTISEFAGGGQDPLYGVGRVQVCLCPQGRTGGLMGHPGEAGNLGESHFEHVRILLCARAPTSMCTCALQELSADWSWSCCLWSLSEVRGPKS